MYVPNGFCLKTILQGGQPKFSRGLMSQTNKLERCDLYGHLMRLRLPIALVSQRHLPAFFLFQEAISLLRKTLEDKNEVYGEVSSEVAETWKLIGSIHLSKGETEKALRALKKV